MTSLALGDLRFLTPESSGLRARRETSIGSRLKWGLGHPRNMASSVWNVPESWAVRPQGHYYQHSTFSTSLFVPNGRDISESNLWLSLKPCSQGPELIIPRVACGSQGEMNEDGVFVLALTCLLQVTVITQLSPFPYPGPEPGTARFPGLGLEVWDRPQLHTEDDLYGYFGQNTLCVCCLPLFSVVHYTCVAAPRAQGVVTFGCTLGRSSYEVRGAHMAAEPYSQTQSFCAALGTLTTVGHHTGTKLASLILLRCKWYDLGWESTRCRRGWGTRWFANGSARGGEEYTNCLPLYFKEGLF